MAIDERMENELMPSPSDVTSDAADALPDDPAALRKRIEELERANELLQLQRRYGLVWEEPKGRDDDPFEDQEVIEQAKRHLPLIAEEPSLAVGSGSNPVLLIEGDNYYSLLGLSYTHHRAVDVIYIDPPYNTGREDFKYNDRFVGEDDAYRHSKWLSFMAPRLSMAHDLLRDEGVLIVSIDDNEFAQLKLLLDEIFGESNFIGNIIRATNSTKSNSNFLSINYDHTFIYARNKAKLEALIKERGQKWEVLKNNVKEYQQQVSRLQKMGLSSEKITEELKELTKYPRFVDFVNYWYLDDRGVYRKGDLGGVKNGNQTPLFNPLTQKDDPVPPGGYRFSATELAKLVADDRVHFHTDGSLPTIKRYLDTNPKQRPKGIMSDDQRPDANLLAAMGLEFDNPKQLAFMRRVLSIFDNDATILDFFAGSGTTGHAVLSLNAEDDGARRCILCTDNENEICREVTYPRLKMAIEGYTDQREKHKKKGKIVEVPGLGGSLRFFKSDRDFVEHSDAGDDMRRDFRTASTDLLRLREETFDTVHSETGFAVYSRSDAPDTARVLGILYRERDADALIAKLKEQDDEAQIVLYGFSLDGQLDGRPFGLAFGDRVILREVPEELMDTYRRLFRRKLFGGWA
jgi:adenine-specific DNA-methyltransferase